MPKGTKDFFVLRVIKIYRGELPGGGMRIAWHTFRYSGINNTIL